jgi:hypothetical protein
MVVGVIALHHDFWFWKDRTLVLGFLPIGLAYHALLTLVASGMMAVLVKYAWPHDLERLADEDAAAHGETGA